MTVETGFSVRVWEPQRDAVPLQSLDSSYSSPGYFEVVSEPGSLTLRSCLWPEPRRHRFPIDLESPRWTQGWVAEADKRLVGFIATELETWNRRLSIWHFYVDPAVRRRGIGTRLMHTALAVGRDQGALTAWAETSSRNLPGVEIYQRLGFRLCGFDQSLYIGTPSEGEFAVYLAQPLRQES